MVFGKDKILSSVMICLCVMTAFTAYAEDVKREILSKEKRLNEIESKKKSREAVIRDASRREGSILAELEAIDRVVIRTLHELQEIERDLERLERRIYRTEAKMALLMKEKERLSGLLQKRLVAIYKMRGGGAIRILLSSSSAGDMERNRRYLAAVIDSDLNLLEEYNENISLYGKELDELENLRRDKSRLREKKESNIEHRKREKRKKFALLEKVRLKKRSHLKALRELEEAGERLQGLLSDLKRKGGDIEKGFFGMRGKLPMPVDGKVVSFYGKIRHPKFHTVTFNNGIFIKAQYGSEIRVVFDGKVAYKGWLKGYGQVLIIDHGGGFYTLFAHLLKVLKDKGVNVRANEVVALVGDTGSLKGTGLYFEIRMGGTPQDPLLWLAKR